MNRSAFAIGIIMLLIGAYLSLVVKQKGTMQIGILLMLLGAYLSFTFRKISL